MRHTWPVEGRHVPSFQTPVARARIRENASTRIGLQCILRFEEFDSFIERYHAVRSNREGVVIVISTAG